MEEHLIYEQQYNKIEQLLDDDRVPQEVWIGTDSVADRVQWLIARKNHLDKSAKHRFEMIEQLVFACNAALKHVQSENAFRGVKQAGLEDEASCLEGLLTEALEFCNPTANAILEMQKAETKRLIQRALSAAAEKV